MSTKPTYEELEQRVKELGQDTLKRKEAEEALLEINTRHSAMISNIGDVIGIMGSDGTIKYKSPNIERWFGWKPEDLVGSVGWHTVHSEDIERIKSEFAKVLEKDNIQTTVEYRYKCKDESYKWIELTAVNCINNPAVTGVLLNYHDITDRKQVEKALVKSRERMELALRGADCGMWDWDMVKDNFTLGPRSVQLLGNISNGSENWIKHIHPDDVKKIKKNDNALIAGQTEVIDYDYRFISDSGKTRWIQGRGRVVEWNKDGKPLRASGTMLDITDKKQSEEKLLRSEEKHRILFESSKDAILVLDPEVGYIDCNHTAMEMFGFSSKNEILKTGPVALSPKYQPDGSLSSVRGREFIGKALQYGSYFWEWTHINTSGVEFPTTVLATKLKLGNQSFIQGTIRDITEHKKLEQQLIKAKEKSEAANKSKSDFLSNISHELRTPMQSVLGFSKLGIEKIDQLSKKKFLDYFQSIQLSGERLLLLINDILDLSKLESGKTKYEFIEEKISEVVTLVINEFKVPFRNKDILVVFNEPEFNDTIKIDKLKITQVLANLIDNAIKFSYPKSKITINIDETEDMLKVSIMDHGIGIPENELNDVFNKFIQSSKTNTGAGGTGLGLAISKEIIKSHNGKIWTENNPEGGATFSFVLPYKQNV